MYIPNPPQNVYPPNLSKCLCPNPLTMNSKQPIIKSEVFNPGGCSMEKREPTTQQWRQIHSCTADPRTHPPTHLPTLPPTRPPAQPAHITTHPPAHPPTYPPIHRLPSQPHPPSHPATQHPPTSKQEQITNKPMTKSTPDRFRRYLNPDRKLDNFYSF